MPAGVSQSDMPRGEIRGFAPKAQNMNAGRRIAK